MRPLSAILAVIGLAAVPVLASCATLPAAGEPPLPAVVTRLPIVAEALPATTAPSLPETAVAAPVTPAVAPAVSPQPGRADESTKAGEEADDDREDDGDREVVEPDIRDEDEGD